MARLRKRSEIIRTVIIELIERNKKEIVPIVMEKFGISRQAVHRHLKQLIDQEVIIHTQHGGRYQIRPQEEWSKTFSLNDSTQPIQEHLAWRDHIRTVLGSLPDNTIAIWQYGFTEMFNNVIDHSESMHAFVTIKKTAYSTEMYISDSGIGIFNKIKQAMNLDDERHAVLELTKGKLTTDPKRHSGEGIFFTSRMFDIFSILSGDVFLTHTYGEDEDWILENRERCNGTLISMKLGNHTARTTKEIFNAFTSGEDFGFTRTVVPVRLAQYGDEKLISRSQAKRLLERVDRFKTVLFDFREVETIGQAFSDEVFRVFSNEHPHIKIVPINANEAVMQMIRRAQSNNDENQEKLF